MPSNKEKVFENHIKEHLIKNHKFIESKDSDIDDRQNHFITSQILSFIKETQKEKYQKLISEYSDDSDDEILKTLSEEVKHTPLWLVMRKGLDVRGLKFDLYYPKPRSTTSESQKEGFLKNKFFIKTQYHFDQGNSDSSIDLVIFLNGLPIITIELKHEDEGQNINNAIDQYLSRDRTNKIFSFPFLHIAADTSQVKVATSLMNEDSFQWFNSGLQNLAESKHEYPIEYLYKNALSTEQILEYLEFYLIYVPEVRDGRGEIKKTASTLFPRYHQLRSSKNLALNIKEHFENKNKLGKKYLIYHSAGSGKTLTISWMADRIQSLFHEQDPLLDMVFVLTDRRNLDKNLKDDLKKFTHLRNVAVFAEKSRDLKDQIRRRKRIILTTIQKFSYIQDLIQTDQRLKELKIAFLIDEAHRSNEGRMAYNMRTMFNRPDVPDNEKALPEIEEEISDKLKRLDISKQILIAFTATPTKKTVDTFGDPFDTYLESEAIAEGYILDVASNILSYKTLYNLKSEKIIPLDKFYPSGVVSKALRNIAYNDEELIQYKSEVVLNYFQEHVDKLLAGKAKVMVVASSRPAGLVYYNTLKGIIKARDLPYKILFAFSDYTDKNNNPISEIKVNELDTVHNNKVIEDVFEEDEYRIIVVANKFQTGFNQPKLVSMFLDKSVSDVNAVQTLSRLNRNYPGKNEPTVIDFTNNVKNIFKAFSKYRTGIPFFPEEPDPSLLIKIYKKIIAVEVFSKSEIDQYLALVKKAIENPKLDADLMQMSVVYSTKFLNKLSSTEERKQYLGLLNKYVNYYYFIAKFYAIDKKLEDFLLFAETIKDKLVKKGTENSLREYLKHIKLERGAVLFEGKYSLATGAKRPVLVPTKSPPKSVYTPGPRSSIPDLIESIKRKHPISDKDALVIREISQEQVNNESVSTLILRNRNNVLFIEAFRKGKLRNNIIISFYDRDLEDKLLQKIYSDNGGIVDLIAENVVNKICSDKR